jgi:hypothetical protein
MRSATARPAESSFAELIREPVDRRSIAVDIARSFRWIASRATSEEVFVLITVIECSPKFLDFALATVVAIAELLPLSCHSGHQSDVICRTLKKINSGIERQRSAAI